MGGGASGVDPIWLDVTGAVLCVGAAVGCLVVAARIVLGFLGIA